MHRDQNVCAVVVQSPQKISHHPHGFHVEALHRRKPVNNYSLHPSQNPSQGCHRLWCRSCMVAMRWLPNICTILWVCHSQQVGTFFLYTLSNEKSCAGGMRLYDYRAASLQASWDRAFLAATCLLAWNFNKFVYFSVKQNCRGYGAHIFIWKSHYCRLPPQKSARKLGYG